MQLGASLGSSAKADKDGGWAGGDVSRRGAVEDPPGVLCLANRDGGRVGRRSRTLGVAAAKARGVYKGRPKSVNATTIRRLLDEGLGPSVVAKQLGISRASVYRLAE